ncbi:MULTISPECIES: RHS repeat domain-containing protein [Flavobacterium]|uniref:RHS repeat-associated core domain-containing protein n=1 Tax=Flavobacterium keumense TaxID=1306518 RepID=A0ABY8N681_9FLAO|nr:MULTISPECIES: RHS repeat-associated core domain-containing protein [Flavobacterium]WGK95147.1 RHS repeat-associated core domain-containing protein [Flavobacterium keumense]
MATSVKGLATGSWTRVATTTAETKGETAHTLYDVKYHPVRTHNKNYLGGYTYTDSKVDAFTGQVQYTIERHRRLITDTELVVKQNFTYSAQDRLMKHTHQINGGAEQLLAENTYDELGQLVSKKVGNTIATPLQKVDYTYNIRGWMKSINNPNALQQGSDPADLFGFKINYNTVEGSVAVANKLYNGNIAETFWSTATDGGFVRNYGYKYDQLNRLKDATYQKSNVVTNMYNENLTYDKNGNILTLKRNGDRDVQTGTIGIDNLSYGYATNSNKLMSVVDNTNNTSGFNDFNKSGNDYAYDANGNMTLDKNKKITSIVYNHLNLPTKIVFPTGNIVYIYNASGQKVQKVVTENTTVTTTDYLGGYQYRKKTASEPVELQFFPTAEGYVKNTPVSGTNTYSYVYNYTDHLGNTRLSYTKNPSSNVLTILEESNYYPFGLKHNGYNPISPVPENRRLFNGKELQEELGLNMYDYGSRMYDPARAGWSNVDPLAEKMRRWSPYNYAFDNPIRFIDPDGMAPTDWFVNTKTGTVVHVEGQSKLTQSTADKIGAGDAKNYERLGADNMFGDKNGKANKIREQGASVVENSEVFMEKQGYNKAEKVKIVETEYTSGGKVGEENISLTHSTIKQVGESKITYAKPENLDSKADIQIKSSSSTYSSIETTKYILTKPYGQDNNNTSVYGSKETSNNILKPLQIIGDLVQQIISK